MSIFIFLLVLFWATLVGVTSAAFTLGGKPERIGISIIVLGSVVSAALSAGQIRNHGALDLWMLLSDSLVLLALGRLALTSPRYWPMWATSFHSITVLTHIADVLIPKSVPTAYLILQGFWVYPMFIAVSLGVYGHSQIAKFEKRHF
jgi:hypothetical protein